MPIEDLKSDIAVVQWDIGNLKVDKRTIYAAAGPEYKIISSTYPYTVRLEEKPYQTSGVEIDGYTEVTVMPTSSTEFYVDYEDCTLYFHSSQAGTRVQIYYYGMGSVVAANDINRFANFLCSIRDLLLSFMVEATDPISQSVNMTGGYLNKGTSLALISDKILKFGAGEEYAVTAMTAFYWRKLLISVNTITEAIIVTEGAEAVTQPSAVIPGIPTDCRPCALIGVQDNGNAGTGTIQNISSENITDIRAFIE
jgi:hypothetical protein